ncbi:hypothetical protein C1890_16800 [Pseudomonas sp. DP16D-R1]|nr:hypothetical protein C1890_16800 [Pseudomonas sp. DP16D-R1]
MASPAVLGWRLNWRRQALHQDPDPFADFFVWGIEKAKPRGWPFGASSFLEGECKHAQNPTSEHPKAKPRSFAGFGVSISSCRGVVQEDLAGMISAPTP